MLPNSSPMAAKHNRRPIAVLPLFLFLLVISRCVQAQSPENRTTNSRDDNGNNYSPRFTSFKFTPSIAIIIVVLISAFFSLGFFSIYLRQCDADRIDPFASGAVTSRARIQHGLKPSVLQTFPTLVYSEVKEHKIGKGALECAICLNEFEDDETIRLLPKCDHVFHQECIDAWLDTHVTCPVCRTNYAFNFADRPAGVPAENNEANAAPVPPEAAEPPDMPPTDHVAILVDDVEERKEEMRELARIASRVRGNGARRSRKLARSHSTGHSMVKQGEPGLDRYTLRLPEKLRKEIIAAGRLQRAKTFGNTVSGAGEGSMRRVSRGVGEGSSRMTRTIWLGRSDRWPSFFGRSPSGKISGLGNWRRGEEGSVKVGSMSRKLSGIKIKADCLGSGSGAAGVGSKGNTNDDSDESSTAALNRV